jgi:hypothetical protein
MRQTGEEEGKHGLRKKKKKRVEAYIYIDASSVECIDNKLDKVPGTGTLMIE